jgi:hypothetical protein
MALNEHDSEWGKGIGPSSPIFDTFDIDYKTYTYKHKNHS